MNNTVRRRGRGRIVTPIPTSPARVHEWRTYVAAVRRIEALPYDTIIYTPFIYIYVYIPHVHEVPSTHRPTSFSSGSFLFPSLNTARTIGCRDHSSHVIPGVWQVAWLYIKHILKHVYISIIHPRSVSLDSVLVLDPIPDRRRSPRSSTRMNNATNIYNNTVNVHQHYLQSSVFSLQ